MKRNIHFLSVVKCKHLFSILLVIPVCSHAGFYDCEREMTVNVFNQAPFSEDVARAAGWTKMPDWKSFYHIEGTWTEVAEKMAQKQAILMIVDSISGGSMSEVAKTMVSDALDVSLNINHKYISPDGKNEAVFSPDKKLVNQGPLQGTYNQIPPDANWIEHMKSSILPHVSCVLNGNFEWEPTKNCFIVDKTGNKQSVDCETGEPNSLGNGFSSPVFQTPDGVVNLSFANETAQNTIETDSGILNKDVLHTLADLLETGEEIVEVRENMRDDRRERKAKEQAERDRQAALEAERLRQQQLAEQRKKSQTEQKKSDKKPEKKTPESQPAKATPTTQHNQSVGKTETIDFSKLNGLVSKQVSFVRGILSSGEKATSAQYSTFNSLNNQYVSEFNRIKAQIAKVSDPEKRSQYYNKLASINRRISSELDPLLAQGQSRGLFRNL